jgi:hypothetical protein
VVVVVVDEDEDGSLPLPVFVFLHAPSWLINFASGLVFGVAFSTVYHVNSTVHELSISELIDFHFYVTCQVQWEYVELKILGIEWL